MKKYYIFLLLLCILSFAGHLMLYPQLPEMVPTHWDFNGEINGYTSKFSTLFLNALPLLLLLAFRFIPRLDPRGKNYKKHEKAYDSFMIAITLLLVALTWITDLSALGYPIAVNSLVPVGVGILFLVVGNYMPQLRSNYTMGIKTPWTIENEWVWKKTHAMGGLVFCAIGILMILGAFLSFSWFNMLMLTVILGSVVWLYLYSYLLYRKFMRGAAEKHTDKSQV